MSAVVDERPSLVINSKGKIRIGNPKHTRPFSLFLIFFTLLCIALLIAMPFDWLKLLSRIGNMGRSLSFIMTLDLSEVDLVLPYFYETLCVAILSTIYSAILGIFLAVFMAKNITPYKFLPPILAAMFTFIRAVPNFIWVLLILVCLGIGPIPAIYGICIHSMAFFARSFAHSFEEVDDGTLEALASTGSNRIKVFFSAVLPSALTMLIAWLTVNFETNFQGASILGMVGAGGIGFIISSSFGSYKYGRAWAAIILVVAFTYFFEISFNALKKRLSV
ncbi:MAG: ABC transporter permease subunit [Oscillospiraceae bacterium]|nr:ABC transporter permease subunit [Oscillospiraceae bacterium]